MSSPTRSEISGDRFTHIDIFPLTNTLLDLECCLETDVKLKNGLKEEIVFNTILKSPSIDIHSNKDNYYHNKSLVKKLITILRHPKIGSS